MDTLKQHEVFEIEVLEKMMLERTTEPTGSVFSKKNWLQWGKPIIAKTCKNQKYKFL